jgi:hypothetical protein
MPPSHGLLTSYGFLPRIIDETLVEHIILEKNIPITGSMERSGIRGLTKVVRSCTIDMIEMIDASFLHPTFTSIRLNTGVNINERKTERKNKSFLT